MHLGQRRADKQQCDDGAEIAGEWDEEEADTRRYMREHHGMDEADPLGDACRHRIGKGAQSARQEEEAAGGFEVQAESIEQPKREQRLDEEAAAEGIEAEERGEDEDGPARGSERLFRATDARLADRKLAIEQERDDPEQSVEQEHRAHRCSGIDPDDIGEESGQACGEGSGRADERADQAVTREERGALVIRTGMRNKRMFERQKQADIARGRIEGTDEADEDERPELAELCKAYP